MFNPLALLSERLLNEWVEAGKVFFVRQTYRRGRNLLDEEQKGAYLITHHDDLVKAETHYSAVAHDPNRYLYKWENEEDQEKLRVAASQPKGYRIYAAVFDVGWENRITPRVKHIVKSYINLLGWYQSGNDSVVPDFYLEFGELHLKLKFRNMQKSVKFDDLDRPR